MLYEKEAGEGKVQEVPHGVGMSTGGGGRGRRDRIEAPGAFSVGGNLCARRKLSYLYFGSTNNCYKL